MNVPALLLALVAFAAWAVLQGLRVRTPFVYVPLAVAAWWCVHESGIHATIAGVALGLLTRVRPDASESRSPAERLEHLLSPISSNVAVPFFALLSAGVVVAGGGDLLRDPVVVGVVLGLVVGKPIGVFGGTWVVTRFTRAELNGRWATATWWESRCSPGSATVSLLVADLSFAGAELDAAKTAVLVGSLVSAVLGALMLGHRDRFRHPGPVTSVAKIGPTRHFWRVRAAGSDGSAR